MPFSNKTVGKHRVPLAAALALCMLGTPAPRAHAQGTEGHYLVPHPECSLFGPRREEFLAANRQNYRLSALTNQVVARLPVQAKTSTKSLSPKDASSQHTSLIDSYLFKAMADAGVTPADTTNDFEFIRRVTLDLTGRIPTPEAVQTFVNDSFPNKRAALIDSLIASPQWVDKWTMYYGDVLKNSSFKIQVNLYNEGRNAFYKWIKDSLTNNKPYDQMVREIIAVKGTNTWDPADGAANWIVGNRITGGPQQDTQDQLAASTAETFLGIANLNCVLCHNGRGHLDTVNLWGKNTSRYQAWQMAAFFSHTPGFTTVKPDPANPNSYYWTWQDNLKTNYLLGSTSGNRPARAVVGTETQVAPVYIFNGNSPAPGDDYRTALATNVTSDFQFARATVNYMWEQFFGRGIVSPSNQFDLARLDPDNPPTDPSPFDPTQPWPLQPSNPRLLNALSQAFVDHGFDIKWLMRTIVNSDAYQLSSRYDPAAWNPQWESLFARKLVRRLWSEEIHDAVAQSSKVAPAYKIYEGQDPTAVAANTVTLNWAMQLPEVSNRGYSIPANAFLDAFLRGNRDDNPRKGDASLTQALDLMNDTFVMSRVKVSTSGATSLINTLLASKPSDATLVSTLYLNVLSRYPSDQEMNAAVSGLQSSTTKNNAVENLLWSLYNKVDFIFNY